MCEPQVHAAPWTGPAWLNEMLQRLQNRYEARRSAAALGRVTDDDLRDMGLTRADAEFIQRHPYRH